jgi:hypothetical protein
MAISSFKRIEKKYIVTEEQKNILLKEMEKYMELDPYCKNDSTYRIQNIYFDTKNKDLISQSVRKPPYKQKLRARKYIGQKNCFLEIKKKSDGVVGKRRLTLSFEELDDWVYKGIEPVREKYIDRQVVQEISYLLSLYKVEPNTFISYERLGLFDKNDKEFRITFDNQIHAKKTNFEWDTDDYEINLLEEGYYIMEIKTVKNFPLWLVRKLSELKIYPHSFSKYGTEYLMEVERNKGGKVYESI